MTVSFVLEPEQHMLKKAARQFAHEHLVPLAAATKAEHDPLARAQLARPVMERAVAAGFLKGLIPQPFGGTASSGVDASIFIEELATVNPSFVISMAGPLIALAPVYQAGTPQQVQRFVAPFLVDSGSPVAAMAYSEPAGSANFDAEAPAEGTRTTAVRDGDHWVINGEKIWASHLGGWDGRGPDLMVLVARTPVGVSLIAVEREHLTRGFGVEEHYDLTGLRGCLTSRVRFTDVRVPVGNLVGQEGQGVQLTRDAFVASGASIAIFTVAAMRAAFGVALTFARTQRRGGAVPVIAHQAVADVLSDAKGRIEATRLLGWRAMDAVISASPAGLELALHAKVLGSETGTAVITDLLKVVGVSGYDLGFPLMEHLADALAYPVIEGNNVGVRRRQLHTMIADMGWDPLAASGLA